MTVSKSFNWSSAYGKLLIDSGCHRWKFRVNEKHSYQDSLSFGITKENECQKKLNNFSICYGWIGTNPSATSNGYHNDDYGSKIKLINGKSETVEMIFDADEPSLRYIINDKDYGVIPLRVPIDPKVKYRMAVCFYCAPQNIDLLDYQQIR